MMMKSNNKIKIIIADDCPMYVEALKILLSSSPKYFLLDVYKNGFELVSSPKLQKADLLIIDVNMPVMNGLEAAKKIDIDYPYLPMIAISMYEDNVYLKDFIEAGFKGFVNKTEAAKNLTHTIEQVLNKNFVFSDNLKIA